VRSATCCRCCPRARSSAPNRRHLPRAGPPDPVQVGRRIRKPRSGGGGMMRRTRGCAAVLALGACLGTATPARAGYLEDAGWGTLTVLTNVVYMPAKIIYATAGGLTGAFALALTGGDMATAETVWVTTMAGTYVVTPGMLQGQDPISFAGTPAPAATAAETTQPVEEQPLGGS